MSEAIALQATEPAQDLRFGIPGCCQHGTYAGRVLSGKAAGLVSAPGGRAVHAGSGGTAGSK